MAVRRTLLRVLPVSLLLLTPRPAGAAGAGKGGPAAVLTVAPDQVIAPVNRRVLGGFNFGSWMSVPDFVDDLKAAGTAELRFPGGEVGDASDLTAPDLATFQANLAMLGDPTAVVEVRVGLHGVPGAPGGDGSENAAADVRWAKDKGIPVRYWELGNEPDRYSQRLGAQGVSPERYCEVFRAQAAAMKQVDPTVRVAGPAVSGVQPGSEGFLAAFVMACGDVIDVLTWHLHPTDGTLSDEAALDTAAEVEESVARVRSLWEDAVTNPGGHGRKVELAVTQYGLRRVELRPGEYAMAVPEARLRHVIDMPAALWAMEVALRLDAAGVGSAHYFALQSTGGHGLLNGYGARRPTWYAFSVLAGLSGNLVAASTDDKDLWVHAARDGDRLDVVVLNRATGPRGLATRVPGFELRSGTYFDEAIAREEKPMGPVATGESVTLPPRAVVHLVYARR